MKTSIVIATALLLAIAIPTTADPDFPPEDDDGQGGGGNQGPPGSCVTLMLGQLPPVIIDVNSCV